MLRTLVRDRATLVAESADWLHRMQKSLDQMNVRVHRAVSDIDGVTGMKILRAIAEGERDPMKLAKLRDWRCRKNEAEIANQLTGHWREAHLLVCGSRCKCTMLSDSTLPITTKRFTKARRDAAPGVPTTASADREQSA